jgi:hypothetical protein
MNMQKEEAEFSITKTGWKHGYAGGWIRYTVKCRKRRNRYARVLGDAGAMQRCIPKLLIDECWKAFLTPTGITRRVRIQLKRDVAELAQWETPIVAKRRCTPA